LLPWITAAGLHCKPARNRIAVPDFPQYKTNYHIVQYVMSVFHDICRRFFLPQRAWHARPQARQSASCKAESRAAAAGQAQRAQAGDFSFDGSR